uniref:Protein ABIL3-like n=1 Tax=Nelumbo nucifera TaxID=4432 RepID=A0A822YZP2_NELNU|nr:TPA_asm: hypothetical protein HUJ06_006866 [Nelumbo nucifera]
METMPSFSPLSVPQPQEASTYDELSMQQSLLFSDSLKDLKNLRAQLYSAAEYFELSYTNDDQKQIVVETLKDYAIKALVNTVDHLGSMTYKVNGLLDEKVEEVSGTELRVSCIEQVLFKTASFLISQSDFHRKRETKLLLILDLQYSHASLGVLHEVGSAMESSSSS